MERTCPPPPRGCGQTYDEVFFRRTGPVNASSRKGYSYICLGCDSSARDIDGHNKICATDALKCKIKDCQGKSVAKGLCIKHYMRARRRGDPTQIHKLRPKQFELAEELRGMSLQNRARFKTATTLLHFLELSGYEIQQAMQSATRSDGTLNVSRLLAVAQDLTRRSLEPESRETNARIDSS